MPRRALPASARGLVRRAARKQGRIASVSPMPRLARRLVSTGAAILLLADLLASCRPERFEDPLSVLPPPCSMWTAPGADGCLSVREDRQRYELRYEQPFVAASDGASYLGIIRSAKLSFDKAAYFDGPAGVRTPTMVHELLHFWTGPHAPYVGIDTRSTDKDRTEACVSLCFAPTKQVTKCDCALCLAVPRDDARCKSFVDCGS